MKTISKILVIYFFCINIGFGQEKAFINNSEPYGSARTLGLSTQNAIGPDIAAVVQNPANLAMFRRSEVILTPSFSLNSNKSSFLGNVERKSMAGSSLSNFGLAFSTTDDSKTSGFKGYTFGINYSRLASFTYADKFNGFNNNNSVTTYFAEAANQQVSDDPESLNINTAIPVIQNLGQFAWKSQMVNHNDSSGFVGIAENGGLYQEVIVNTEGFNNNWNFSSGINLNDVLYLGAAVNINQFELMHSMRLSEDDNDSLVNNFKHISYEQKYSSAGIGQGFSLGIIYRPTTYWRVGLSFESAVQYTFDIKSEHLLTDVDLVEESEVNLLKSYRYIEPVLQKKTIRSPKVGFGFYYQFGKNGFISTDFNYRFTKNDEFNNRNYFSISNGGEVRKDIYRFRAGLGVESDFKSENYKINPFGSLGVGLRGQLLFADLAFYFRKSSNTVSPYILNDSFHPKVVTSSTTLGFAVTLGTKF